MKYIEDNIKWRLARRPSEMLRGRRNDKIVIALAFLAISTGSFADGSYGFMSLTLVMAFLSSLDAYESHRASAEFEKRKHVIIEFKKDADREKVFKEGTTIVEEMLSRDVIESVTFDMKDKTT